MNLSEVDQQPYRNCVISSGLVHDAPPDEIYLKFAREDEEPTIITLRQDEAIRIAALLCNAVWSALLYPPADEDDPPPGKPEGEYV